jgi:hypothetical protein
MIIDSYNEFSDAQAETTVAAHASTNVIDLGAAGDAEVRRLRLHILTQTAVTSDGAATVQFKLETDDNASFSSATTLWDSGAIGKATLVQGYRPTGQAGLPLPSGCERYLRVTYTIATAALTAGKFDAYLADGADTNDFQS